MTELCCEYLFVQDILLYVLIMSRTRYHVVMSSMLHFFLHCHYYTPTRKTLFEEVKTIDANLLKLPDCKLTDILLYGCSHFDENQNQLLLISSIEYIMNSKRFDDSLF